MSKNHQIIVSFVLDQVQDVPIQKRIVIMRALAETIGNEREGKELHSMADALMENEMHLAKFQLTFGYLRR